MKSVEIRNNTFYNNTVLSFFGGHAYLIRLSNIDEGLFENNAINKNQASVI